MTATGKRKTAVAQVRLKKGKGRIIINGKSLSVYFNRKSLEASVIVPLQVTKTLGQFDAIIRAHGGGIASQAGASRLGIARALLCSDDTLKKTLRSYGLLTRDPRAKERKKYGFKRARKGFQYRKR